MDAATFTAAVQAFQGIPELLREEICEMADAMSEAQRKEALKFLKGMDGKMTKNREETLVHAEAAVSGMKEVNKMATKWIRTTEEQKEKKADASSAEQLLNDA
jgi:hypothetical protein